LLRATPRWTAERYNRFYQESYRDLYSPLGVDAGAATLLRLAQGPGAVLVGEFVAGAWRRFGNPKLQRPSIVEIGAGGGWNLARLSESWIRIGYDTDERFLAQGRAAFGLDLRKGLLAEALGAAAEADCILLSHVLEHVPDPVAALQTLRRAARPDALVLIEVPGIFRLHKTGLDPMRYWQNAHTFTFCARTITDTCRRAGYEPVSVDEWVRLVLKGSCTATPGPVRTAPRLARSIERYLRYCELSHRMVQDCAKAPLLGTLAARTVSRGADGLMRAAATLGLIAGMRITDD
jgi:SAM-dependent methyltransferase